MYGFVTHTFNPIKGKCIHDCCYCYMKRFPQKELRLVEKELETDLGSGNFIFVGSSTDMFAEDVEDSWIRKVLEKCKEHNNKYLFQSKNVDRMARYSSLFPKGTVLGTTIETNYETELSVAPSVKLRAYWLKSMKPFFDTMVTIEPVFDFDKGELLGMIDFIKPNWVNIGSDSNNKKDYLFEEPSKEKLEEFIEELKKKTKVIKKSNLCRLLK